MSWKDAKEVGAKLFAELKAANYSHGMIEVILMLLDVELNRAASREGGHYANKGNLEIVERLHKELTEEFPPAMVRIIVRATERELKREVKACRAQTN